MPGLSLQNKGNGKSSKQHRSRLLDQVPNAFDDANEVELGFGSPRSRQKYSSDSEEQSIHLIDQTDDSFVSYNDLQHHVDDFEEVELEHPRNNESSSSFWNYLRPNKLQSIPNEEYDKPSSSAPGSSYLMDSLDPEGKSRISFGNEDRDNAHSTPLYSRPSFRRKPPKPKSRGFIAYMKDQIQEFKQRKSARNNQLQGPRIIYINDPARNYESRFINNSVSTAKYNIITLIPKFLLEQFSQYSNIFFLLISILQQIPGVSPTNKYTTIGPLCFVLLVSAFKELAEDYQRHLSDREVNRSWSEVLQLNSFRRSRWTKIAVGDIIKISSEEPIPADIVVIATSEPEGLCYIETANLDGETNLKVKQALPETAHLVDPTSLASLNGKIECEQPNNKLYSFDGSLHITSSEGDQAVLALDNNQLLLRGAKLRNTPWIYGIVIFTGHETKLIRNATAAPIKRTAVGRIVNTQILALFGFLVVLAVFSTVISWTAPDYRVKMLWYIGDNQSRGFKNFILSIFTFIVLYSNLVPISLFVTIELVKFVQAQLIGNDLDIYYEERQVPTVCRTSNLVEELGQIEYIFSDKTGTLTCNQMEFKQCSIGGRAYTEEIPESLRGLSPDDPEALFTFNDMNEDFNSSSSRAQYIHHFFTLLACCHTVIPETNKDAPKDIKYQASSPDEGALVKGAADLGYRLLSRKPKSINVEIRGKSMNYELLNICEFNSTRKRMSTVFRCPDGKIILYTKGADTVIFERLNQDKSIVPTTLQHLESYASEGLRTLCLAYREIPESEYAAWSKIYHAASTTLNNRADEMEKAAELIEKDLILLGASAIEDRLQDGVPETISQLQLANIKFWVLTGDRQETAINIGMSSKLISEDMSLIIVNEPTNEATMEFITKKLEAIKSQTKYGMEVEPLALIIDGHSLAFALDIDNEQTFLELAILCKSVLCCRVSPLQKALVVKLVKKYKTSLLLAIGDGANDVGMIQAAHVGVGINGFEGVQASRSADFSIGQFKYLKKLLLVHGTWSYQRLSKMILYSFYKNIALYVTQFWYATNNAFSGETIYESWTMTLYNVLFTFLPPISIGIFDQIINARYLDRYPQLYLIGQKGSAFNLLSFWTWFLNGLFHSALMFYLSAMAYKYDSPIPSGQNTDHWSWGVALYSSVLLTVLGKAALITNAWTKHTLIAIPGSLAIWALFFPLYSIIAPKYGLSMEYNGILPYTYGILRFYATVIILSSLCLTRDFLWKYVRRMYFPLSYHHIQEIQKYNVADYRPRMEQFQKAIRKVRQIQRIRKQRGFAFSQAEDKQSTIIRAYDTTQKRGRFGELHGQ